MKGKRIFTPNEIEAIKELISKKVNSSKNDQKNIRNNIRKIGFYFSDFSNKKGYTVVDFEGLLKSGVIQMKTQNSQNDFNKAKEISKHNTHYDGQSSQIGGVSQKLPDVIACDLKVIFCGTAVGRLSAKRKAYYAHPNNKFWKILTQIKLTPRKLFPSEYNELLQYGIGLTDLAKNASGRDLLIHQSDYDVKGFEEKIRKYSPDTIAFNGKEAAKNCFGKQNVSYGRYVDNIENSVVFVLPSTSSLASQYWDENIWYELARHINK